MFGELGPYACGPASGPGSPEQASPVVAIADAASLASARDPASLSAQPTRTARAHDARVFVLAARMADQTLDGHRGVPELYAIIGSSLPDPSRHVSPLDVRVEPAHENAARLVPQQPPENVVVMVAPAALLPDARHTSFTLLQSAPAAP
jgi:hypothetical protein